MSWLAVPAVAAAWLLQYFGTPSLLAWPAVAWCAIALLAWYGLGGRVALLVLLAGWTLCRAAWLVDAQLPAALAGRDLLVQGVVCDFPRPDAEAQRLVLETGATDRGEGLPARLHLSWYAPSPPLRPGERWQLLVRLKPPHGLANPGGFDFEQWLYQRGIGASGYVRASRLNRRLEAQLADCPVGTLRATLAGRIEAARAGRPGSAHVLGLTVGVTAGLSPADWELMRRTGTTHLLAISGFNIALVAAPFVLLVPWLGHIWPWLAGRPGAGPALALAVATLYSALAGFGVSVLRALLMLGVVALLAWRRRPADSLDALAAAALLILAIDPASVLSAGFWLSFAGVAWLLVAATRRPRPAAVPPRGLAPRIFGGAVSLLRLQLLLGIGLAPLTLAYFQQLSLVAPLANLLAVPVFSLVVMPLALGGAALLLAFPLPGTLLLRLAAAVVARLMDLLAALAGMLAGDGAWQPPPQGIASLVLCLVAAVMLAWWRPLPLRLLAGVLLLPLVAGSDGRGDLQAGELRVTVMDVGQGLAVLLQTASHSLVYDAGPAYRLRDAGDSVVVPVLRAAGIRQLDALLISHDDLDHAGGAATVLRAYPGTVLVGGNAVRLAAARARPCVAGEAWLWDGVRFSILNPPAGAQLSDNDASCVLRVDAAGGSVLLPGDVQLRQEAVLAARGALAPVDLLLAPHHGSRSSSGPALVAATRPRVVVFSAGYMNRWGFPAEVVRERWEHAGACTFDTSATGALVFVLGGQGLRLARITRRDDSHLWTTPMPAASSCTVPGQPRALPPLG